MKPSEQIIYDTYAAHQSIWERAWRKQVIYQLAKAAKDGLKLNPIQFGPQVATLAAPSIRASVVKEDPSLIVEELVASKGQFRSLLTKAFDKKENKKPSGKQLRPILQELVEKSLRTPKSSEILVSVSEDEVYCELAALLSTELYICASSGTPIDEALILNYAILIYHLYRWKTPFNNLANSVQGFNQGVLGLRGYLISIQNCHRPTNNSNDFVPEIVTFKPAIFSSSIKAQADIFNVVESESQKIPHGAGFFHRAIPVSTPINPSILKSSSTATQEIAEEGRRLTYPQFEHTALSFMSLAGIEFLLRSFCSASFEPDQAIAEVIASFQDLPDALRKNLFLICTPDGWNVRNRCMHGSFLEIEGRREDLIRSSGILDAHGIPRVDLSADGSLPSNISSLLLQTLEDLARHVEMSQTPCRTSWTEHFLLNQDELAEANAIHCDFLQSEDAAEAWRIQIRDFLREFTPSVSTLLQFGMMSWMRNGALDDTFPGFFILTLLFEPLLRLTLHIAGRPILQKSLSRNASGEVYRVQYSMLDSRGLLSPQNIEWLSRHLEGPEKAVAERVLVLATKCRDAVAHGAVVRLTDTIRVTYGHIIIKAIQLVVEAGCSQLASAPSSMVAP